MLTLLFLKVTFNIGDSAFFFGIAQFQYFKIQHKTIDITTRLQVGINPTNSIVYSTEPCAEVYCLMLNFKISKLGYYHDHHHHSLHFLTALKIQAEMLTSGNLKSGDV